MEALRLLCGLLFLTGIAPVGYAWVANRHTSLRHTMYWMALAWIAWALVVPARTFATVQVASVINYLALSLTGCAGVAVLGARRPGMAAWNFVVAGLLAVLLLPVAESLTAARPLHLDAPRLFFLGATLAVVVLNYLPTRLGIPALLLGAGCALDLLLLSGSETLVERLEPARPIGELLIGLAPWAACERLRRWPMSRSEFDLLWLDFRDRYGLVWSQRLREQFNASAAHARWPVILRWNGLRIIPPAPLPEPAVQQEMVGVLRALLKRFGPEQGNEE